MGRLVCTVGALLALAVGCSKKAEAPRANSTTDTAAAAAVAPKFPLVELRAQLKTTIAAETERVEAPVPPAGTFDKVYYDAPLGKNVAYASPIKAGAKRPAMLWLAGGMDWGIASSAWEEAPRENDQSARAFRDGGGIVLMLPSLRGSNTNPGKNECFLGEVDDLLAAADYLAARADVDPKRIYLGGHSTGGTMVLLTVASSDRFRAAFAFGPVADPRNYGTGGCLPANISESEAIPRAPIRFLKDVRTPTWVIEGARSGNARAFPMLKEAMGAAPINLVIIPQADHFSTLAPTTEALAAQILADTGPTPNFKLDVDALAKNIARAGDHL